MGKKHSYGVVLDAGSSGSRVYVYEYKKASYVRGEDDEEELQRLPKVKTKKDWNLKVHPGIATFGETPERVGEDHLKPLVDFALDTVPSSEVENTPIFLLATAGMRLLPADQREAVLRYTCSYFRQRTRFQLPDCDLHIQVIPGETEGLYGWIAANYLLGGFDEPEKHDHGKSHHTYGFLDMGGASAQIAFAPNATVAKEHAEDLKLLRMRKVNGEAVEYGVFVTTWLGFGANEARRRYVEQLLESYPGKSELPDPCLPVGIMVDQTGTELGTDALEVIGTAPHLIGTGNFKECLQTTYPLLMKEKACSDPPCLLNGVHTPPIDFDVNHFVGVSEYWHTTHEIFAMAHKDRAYDFATYQKQVIDFCSRNWADIEEDVAGQKWGHKVDEKTVEEVCFKASWLINMLHEGIGIPRVGLETPKASNGVYSNTTKAIIESTKDRGFLDPFQAVNKIDDMEVSWTLGKMVLYASQQMPAAPGALAVGFGSNAPGSTDFQQPSAEYPHNAGDPAGAGIGDSSKFNDHILSSNYSRRVPGILIVLLIVVLAVYLICGRERRLNLQNRLLSFFGRGGGRSGGSPRSTVAYRRRKGPGPARLLSNKLLGMNVTPAYERLLEEAEDPDDFELSDVGGGEDRYSDSSDHSGSNTHTARPVLGPRGRTSGVDTPCGIRGLSPDGSALSRSITSQSYKSTIKTISKSGGGGGGYFDLLDPPTLIETDTGIDLLQQDQNTPASAPGGVGGYGLGITPFERVESRERLSAGTAPMTGATTTTMMMLRRPSSRPSSPATARRSPLITPFLGAVNAAGGAGVGGGIGGSVLSGKGNLD